MSKYIMYFSITTIVLIIIHLIKPYECDWNWYAGFIIGALNGILAITLLWEDGTNE